MLKTELLFSPEMKRDFKCHPYAVAPRWNYQGDELHDVYRYYSDAKLYAYSYCKALCQKYNGYDFAISGHNCMTFSVNFRFVNPLNGHIMLAVITKSYNHLYFE